MKSITLGCSLVFLFVVGGCATVEPDPIEPGAVVALAFQWEPGLQADVTSTRSRTRARAGSAEKTSSMASRYSLHVGSEGEQLRIRFDDLQLEVDGQKAPPAEAMQLIAQMGDLAPDYLVTTEGEFVSVHDMPTFQKKIEGVLADVIPAEAAEAMGPILDVLTSEKFLNSRAAEQWNAIVGAWVGAELELGAEYEAQIREPVPVVQGAEVLMNYTFSIKGLVSCERGGVQRQCVDLEMRSTADPDDTKAMIEAFIESVAGKILPETPVIQKLALDNVLHVLTEPDGLVPHEYTLTKNIRATVAVGDQEGEMEQVDTTETTYRYR